MNHKKAQFNSKAQGKIRLVTVLKTFSKPLLIRIRFDRWYYPV